jgi:N-acetylglucosaminyldiphosphoundecaprenol N-acetyl-beta-D-mannosaminyltransferase
VGVELAVSDYEEVIDWMEAVIAADGRAYVTAAAVNLVMSAHEDPDTRAAVLGATLAVPDGQPLVWALRALGEARATRVYGPDLMARFCARAARGGCRFRRRALRRCSSACTAAAGSSSAST